MFSVTAQTRLGWGKTAYALVFTTNNRERPQAPSMPQVSRSQVQSRQITFTWTPGRDGFAPLRYIIYFNSTNVIFNLEYNICNHFFLVIIQCNNLKIQDHFKLFPKGWNLL